jgi:Cytochrome c554 and c-prime
MRGYLLGILAAASALTIASCSSRGPHGGSSAREVRLTLFALAEIRGQVEPCGCTTDPLGDLARTAELVTAARAQGPVLVVDAGSLLYSQPEVAEQARPQAELKADLLASVYRDRLAVAAVGLGPYDLAGGPGKVRLPRQVANLPATAGVALEAPKVIDVGGAKVGVFGVVAPELVPTLGATDPIAAATEAVAKLRQDQAGHVIALASMSKKDAVKLVRAVPGIDVVVIAAGLEAPLPDAVPASAEQVGSTWIVMPTDRGQVVSRLSLTLRGAGPLVDAIGPEAAVGRQRELAARVATLDEQLAAWASDPTADAAFVAERKQERAQLASLQAALERDPVQIPARGSYFQLAQIRIAKILACDPLVVTAKQSYSRASGAANVAAASSIPPVPVPPGAATYVGSEACADCHEAADKFWKASRHAGAWRTLEKVDKQFDYECTGCHVTGWNQPGGSTMAKTDGLRDVQCETCHGPGSIHVDADDADAKKTIQLAPADNLCATQCHTREHSDTFDRVSYLRDVVGPGHGEHFADELGPGPTGRELRKAGLAKAGAVIGAGCPK